VKLQRLPGLATVLMVIGVGSAFAQGVTRFDGAWTGTATLNPWDTRCSDARVRMQVDAGKISGRVTWPAGSSDVSGEVAEDGTARVKLTSIANGRASNFVGQFTERDFKAYDRGRTCSFDFTLGR
jgi:hypothetical protein